MELVALWIGRALMVIGGIYIAIELVGYAEERFIKFFNFQRWLIRYARDRQAFREWVAKRDIEIKKEDQARTDLQHNWTMGWKAGINSAITMLQCWDVDESNLLIPNPVRARMLERLNAAVRDAEGAPHDYDRPKD